MARHNVDLVAVESDDAEPKAPQIRLEDQLCFALYAASRKMTNAYRPLLAPLGLTYPQYLVMIVLWQKDGITISELGARLQLDFGTLTPLLKRMQSRALIQRQRSATDERNVLIKLTRAGRRLQEEAASIPSALRCQIDLPSSKTASLRRDLRGLILALPDIL